MDLGLRLGFLTTVGVAVAFIIPAPVENKAFICRRRPQQ